MLERYNRNILIDQIGSEGQQKLLNSKILVAGAGGLGSSVISSLASVGIGTLGIIDNDKIELSNLNRQFIHRFDKIGENKVNSAKEWVKNYNSDIKTNIYQIRLDENNCNEILSEYDLIMDCFDSFESKFILNKVCVKNGKPLIHAGVSEFYGQVMAIIPGQTACLNCLFPEYNNESSAIKGVLSPAVNIIGSIQSMEAVKILLNIGMPLKNQLLSYHGLEQTFKKINVEKNINCPVCGKIN